MQLDPLSQPALAHYSAWPTLPGLLGIYANLMFLSFPDKLFANGVLVSTESEQEVSKGRIFFIDELLFVDYDRVREPERDFSNDV